MGYFFSCRECSAWIKSLNILGKDIVWYKQELIKYQNDYNKLLLQSMEKENDLNKQINELKKQINSLTKDNLPTTKCIVREVTYSCHCILDCKCKKESHGK